MENIDLDIEMKREASKSLEQELNKEYVLVKQSFTKTIDFQKIAIIADKLAELTRKNTRIRVIFDYDPDAAEMVFRYYVPKDVPLDRWISL